MQAGNERWQEDLFIPSPLRDLVPEDHILKRANRVSDLPWLRDSAAGRTAASRHPEYGNDPNPLGPLIDARDPAYPNRPWDFDL
jgi:hypothetical protein